MADQGLPGSHNAIIDLRTGRATNAFWRLLELLWRRTGGFDDILDDLSERDAGLASLINALGGDLRAEISDLARTRESLFSPDDSDGFRMRLAALERDTRGSVFHADVEALSAQVSALERSLSFRAPLGEDPPDMSSVEHLLRSVFFAGGLDIEDRVEDIETNIADPAYLTGIIGNQSFASTSADIGFRVFVGNIADDASDFISIGNNTATAITIIGNVDAAGVGQLRCRTTATVSAAIGWQIGSIINIVSGDGTLSGTTGPDTNLNLRMDSSNAGIWIENRTGGIRGYKAYILP